MDNKTNDANDVRSQRQVLDEMLADMRSGDEELILAAIADLGMINFSSEAIARQLEKLSLGEKAEVRAAALNALKLKTSKMVAQKRATENRFNRSLILKEIGAWETDGLIESHRAEVIRRRYDFDLLPEEKAESVAAIAARPVAPPAPSAKPQPAQPEPRVTSPAEPRPTLMQTLLSETSIKIYLYLGAFFVVVAAAILAALVEAARLPVLLVATALFASGSVGFKKRLPQPSFALAIVFSFLLPIDANVISQSLNLSTQSNEIYWTLVFLLMAVIWGFGTWFYSSRVFSVAAFGSLILTALRFSEIFNASDEWNMFSVGVANMAGLLAVHFLKNWKGHAFSQPLFFLAQFAQVLLLAISFSSMIFNAIDSGAPGGNPIASALTWILAASFYVASDFLIPFMLFPWMAVASLFLVPWMLLSGFNVYVRTQMYGFAVWGFVYTLASEFVRRTNRPAVMKYHIPLLVLSAPLFLIAMVLGFGQTQWDGIFVFLLTGIAYTIINVLRPRWYVWLIALLASLGAYFLLFSLPRLWDINIAYQLLGASILLLVPELFFKGSFSFQRSWNWPPVLLGTFLAGLNILIALIEEDSGRSSLVFGVSTLLSAAYALRYKQPLIGYLATASAAIAIVFALNHFEHEGWLLPLTALSVIYYAAGFLLARREGTKPWGSMLIASGLSLGGLVSVLGLSNEMLLGISEPASGWYALVIAALFIIEMYAHKNGWLEIFAEATLSIAFLQLQEEFMKLDWSLVMFSISLLWFTCDVIFKLTLQSRKLELPVKIIAAMIAFLSAIFVTSELNLPGTAACFGVYTLFFGVYAWLHKNPLFGYASTLAFALTVFFGMMAMKVDEWIFPQIAVATLYYATGFLLRRADKAKGWDSTLLFSGLGLGTFVALLAPSQAGGLEKSIPIAITATFYAAEAFARKNIWLGFPANGFYLVSYFVILNELKVDEPQFFSVGAAILGLFQHYLLRRAGQKNAAFLMGIVSQLVLLGTSYIQMVDTGELKYFFLLLFQFLAMLVYGIVVRSRSLIIAPIAIVVLATLTILYNALKDLSLVIIIGITGIILLALGILAVVMRERITNLAERFSDWDV